jgi:hypothetical protein
MYFPRIWEFGSALSKLRNFGVGGVQLPGTPLISDELLPNAGQSGRHCENLKYATFFVTLFVSVTLMFV